MLHYKIKKDNVDNNVAFTPPCCPPPGPGSAPGCDCCYDAWTEELKITSNQYKYWEVKVTRDEQLCGFESAWKDKLKAWMDDLDTANEKADDIYRNTERFINQLNKICTVTTESIRAINILFCLVIDLYQRADHLKERYDELINCIASAAKSYPELSSGGIIDCLADYGKKLQVVLDTRDNLIQSVVTVIEIAHKLQEYLCINERHCGPDRIDYGLINILTYWRDILSGKYAVNHGDCKFHPIITFPIKNSEYYGKIKADLEKTTGELDKHKKDLDNARDNKAGYLASKEGLTRALAEADPAIKCK